MIYLNGQDLNLIGDGLAATPYVLYLAEKHGGASFIKGYCKDIRSLIDFESRNIHFEQSASDDEPVKFMDVSNVFHKLNNIRTDLHMAQGYFLLDNEPIPELPIDLSFLPCVETKYIPDMNTRYVVISPFSRTDYQNNKLWPVDRWSVVAKRLLDEGLIDKIFVVGSYSDEWGVLQYEKYLTCLPSKPLIQILHLLKYANLFLSVDNGISHLAHFGGVSQHLLLQPACLTQRFVCNPRGRYIHRAPLQIPVEEVIVLAKEMLT